MRGLGHMTSLGTDNTMDYWLDNWYAVFVVWLYHPPYTLYYLDSHSSVSIGQIAPRAGTKL